MTSSPLAVVCDFDGTATTTDIGDEISRHFGGAPHWERSSGRFRAGELDTRGIIEAIYQHVTASEAEVQEFAVEVAKLRPGFVELVAAAHDRGVPFILASGGLRQYIEPVLAAQVPPPLRAHIRVMANEAAFSPAGLRVSFPGDAESRAAGCSVCGSCKRVAVAEARRFGAGQVLGLGDGFADRCLAQHADRVFAREGSYLHRYCLEHGVVHEPFVALDGAAAFVRSFAAA